MLKMSFKWGLYAGGVMVTACLSANLLFLEETAESYELAETLGYVSIFASLGLIYLALHDAQTKFETAELTLWQRIFLGVMISAVAGVMFGIYNVVYTTYIDPEFMENYLTHFISQMPVQSGPEYEANVAELKQDMVMFSHPASQFAAMAATVLAAGIPVSVLLAFVQKWQGGRNLKQV
ncbi:MAG: DUF4199 domain-containing protein [Kordiimonadaceae bacterium]|nr:DUF4199 domain-containing protein [Kordiimonadaceae bacterium]